jgi:F-box and WD-40 domain protein CDC4
MHLADHSTLPTTPDLSDEPGFASTFFPDTFTPRSGLSQAESFNELESPASPPDPLNEDLFVGAVATPPVADSDLEPLDSVDASFGNISGQRQLLNTSVQNASLPSPGLSPSFHSEDSDDNTAEDEYFDDTIPTRESSDTQDTLSDERMPLAPHSRTLQRFQPQPEERSFLSRSNVPSVLETRSMLESFDSMPNDMKSFMMYQFLRRCSKKTLHIIADVVNPALKCDFIDQLPPELSLHILSFFGYRDLCRAAQVSKRWRDIIDTNESGWKDLFDCDGFVLPIGELEKAIKQGWGWQDPYGPDDFERDLSISDSASAALGLSLLGSYKPDSETIRKGRPRKRKGISYSMSSDRAKRRAVGHEFTEKAQDILAKYPYVAKFDKSEGPLTAASAAALAVPDPGDSVECPPSMRKLHLFKSLYRRHYILQHSWTSGKVAPHHFAFPAHPSHVITCLQFDDDKILTGSDDTLIHVYDTRTGVLRKKLEGHEGGVWALQYEGNVLVSGSTDRSVRVWDIEKGLCTQVFHGHTSTVRCLQILMPEPTGQIENGQPVMLPEKPLIITGSRDSQLRVWKLPEQGSKRYIQAGPPANDADCPYFVRVLSGHSHSVRAIAAHQDTLVSGSYDNTVRVWKISTGETMHRLQGHSMKVYSVVLDHKRNRCISGSMDNYVKIWSLETGVCLYTLEGHNSLVGLLDLRDERLVSAAADSTLRIWDPENGQCKSTLTAHTGAITCFQHDGQKVISGSDRTLKMWDVKTGECIKDLLTDLSGVWQVKFDERRCVAAVQRDNLTFVEVRYKK